MYVSDYGYAASPENWLTSLDSYDNDTNRNSNWMFMGLHEWTISPVSASTTSFFVRSSGNADGSQGTLNWFPVRPTFYLKSNVTITSGDGSSTNPYRLELN